MIHWSKNRGELLMALGCILNDLVIDVGAEIEMRCSKLHNNLIQYFVARLEGLRKVSLSPLMRNL